MPTARPVPPLDSDKAQDYLGPLAAPFMLGYTMMRMTAEMSLFWCTEMFAPHPFAREEEEDDDTLPVPDTVENEQRDTELFA
jgi:hypothetical protein